MVNRILQGLESTYFFDKFIPSSMLGQSCCVKTVYLIGLVIMVRFIIRILYGIWDLWLAPKNLGSLSTRFGLGSYVVITGTTAGIGKQLAKDFTALGFNIVQISRNAQKLAKTEEELKAINPDVKVVTSVIDLAKPYEENFLADLWEKTQDLNISILVNNAGVDSVDMFHEHTTEFVNDMVNINVNSVTAITKLYIEKLHKRQSPTAVIVLSSLAGIKPMAYFNPYSATKAYENMFCKCMNKEYPRIQFLSVTPSEVSTQMSCYKPKDIVTISASECT